MKKVFLLALMVAVVILGSCKKESKEDPVTPTPTPESDSVNIELRCYMTNPSLRYLDRKIFITLPGDTEKLATLPEPQALDAAKDLRFITIMESMTEGALTRDSGKVFILNYYVKKGQLLVRNNWSAKNVELPDSIPFGSYSLVSYRLPNDELYAQYHFYTIDTDSAKMARSFKLDNKHVDTVIVK